MDAQLEGYLLEAEKENLEHQRIFMICPVRGATEEEKEFLRAYKKVLQSRGAQVHYPEEDTIQQDPTGGYGICTQNGQRIINSTQVRVYWTKKSGGSLYDLGTAFNEHLRSKKPIRLINRDLVKQIKDEEGKSKSFEHVLLRLDSLAKSY